MKDLKLFFNTFYFILSYHIEIFKGIENFNVFFTLLAGQQREIKAVKLEKNKHKKRSYNRLLPTHTVNKHNAELQLIDSGT